MKILYLKTENPFFRDLSYYDSITDAPTRNDFMHDTLLIGLRNNFGNDVVDYPGAWYMYPEERKKRANITGEEFFGKLYTLYDSLENYNSIDREDVKNKIKKNFFDLIIYGSIRGKNIFLEEAINSKTKIIFVDTSDDGFLDESKINKGLYFKRELYSSKKIVYPIHFAIPKKKIISSINIRPKNVLSPLIPGRMKTYIYEKENKYYNMYQNSIFSLTYRKTGWDCLRHYEILANGSIPMFLGLDDCPTNTLTNLPKKKLLEMLTLYSKIFVHYNPFHIYKKRFRNFKKFFYFAINIYKKLPNSFDFVEKNPEINQLRNHLLEFTKNNLTSEKLGEYLINASRIFFKG